MVVSTTIKTLRTASNIDSTPATISLDTSPCALMAAYETVPSQHTKVVQLHH